MDYGKKTTWRVPLVDFDGNPIEGYKQFEATSIYCPRCKEALPVRKRLLLILPEGEEYEYLCARCGSSVAIKLEKGKEEVKVLIEP